MTLLNDAPADDQRRRAMRPNAHLYWRPDAARLLPAHLHHLLPPQLLPSQEDDYDRTRPNAAQWTGRRGRWMPERDLSATAIDLRRDLLRDRQETEERHAELLALKSQLLLLRMGLLLRRYERALWEDREGALKAGFRPDQPRWPAGSGRISGRWSGGAGTGGPVADANPGLAHVIQVAHGRKVPEQRPPTAQERLRILRELASRGPAEFWIGFSSGATWLAEEAASFFSYFDPPKSLQELQEAVSYRQPGYDIHHIVERGTAAADGSEDHRIIAPENLVRIPRWKHWELNRWYETPNDDYGGLTPRNYLRGKSWEERDRVGLQGLVAVGVLKR